LSSLKINEIYTSIQGESSYAGLPCTFVRMSGCPLRCNWCDTAYAFDKGAEMSMEEIIADIKLRQVKLVELTGGEPLAQKESLELLDQLESQGFKTMIETGGSEPIEHVNRNTHIVMDLKCPDSKMSAHNLYSNLEFLKSSDEIKFVIASKEDYTWCKNQIAKYDLSKRFNVLLSTAFGLLKAQDLVEWMLEDKLEARFQLQMHKYIWHPRTKGV